MKNLILLLFLFAGLQVFAQKQEKDIKYFYYYLNQDESFMSYLKARKEFESKKVDFKLPVSKEAVKELEANETKILKNEKSYAEFLNKYGMKNGGDYAKIWFNQLNALKTFIKKNPEFYKLTPAERQNIIDKWYFSDVLK
ncbi:hypothetical protein [Pedobacter puniceum]|jgi:hypothetical protein|uniref:Uncharacterized protein n=1 Tax=Pedobacter puniceum TaxID=2666136 RepID=A0A7K0FP75_9SPHI|nr:MULTISPECIES: hypothetical protein [Pedobacter]KHJ38347.1 hypothetical protein PBAC_15500 [Pedobacter glucosidilyticus]MRX47794.1 hypothetical protein [Pedobacter puniceum]